VAAPDELRKAYFEGYEDALKDRSAPAEVAEGAGEVPDVCIANDPLRTRFDLPRAAPPLSREEWGMLYRLLDKEIPPGVKTAELEPWIALRAKVREAAKSRP
jgi:hypothetical protein